MLRQFLSSHVRNCMSSIPYAVPAGRQVRTYGFGSQVSDNNPEVLSKEKEKQRAGKHVDHVPDAPGWNERLASDSEAVVKAETSKYGGDIEDLQKMTVETVQKETEQDDSSLTAADNDKHVNNTTK